jgi:hypothetical protein
MILLIHLSADILVDTKQEICSLNCSKQGECQKEEQIRFHSGWSEVSLIDLIHSYQVIFNQSSSSNSRICNAQRNCDHNLFHASLQSLYRNRSSSPKSFGSVLTLEIKWKWLLLLVEVIKEEIYRVRNCILRVSEHVPMTRETILTWFEYSFEQVNLSRIEKLC